MDAQTASNIVVALSALAGVGLGAFATYRIEKWRQKSELERLKLAWKREERQRRLEPIRNYLDKIVAVVHEYGQAKTRMDVLNADQQTFAAIESNLRKKLDETFSKEGSIVNTIWDKELRLLLIDITFAAGEPGWRITNEEYKNMIATAYKRLEELASEL